MHPTLSSQEKPTWPVFILTLEGDDIRRKSLCDYLDKHAIKYELVFGVDGRKGLPPEYEKIIDHNKSRKKYFRALTDGELACGLGHRKLYERIQREGLEGAIILEDDAILEEDFPRFLSTGIYRDYPLLLLDYTTARVHRKMMSSSPYGEIYRLALSTASTVGYCLTRDAAGILLRAHESGFHRADWPCELAEFGAAAISPRMVRHEQNGTSHLEAKRSVVPLDKKPISRFFSRQYLLRRWRLLTAKKIK